MKRSLIAIKPEKSKIMPPRVHNVRYHECAPSRLGAWNENSNANRRERDFGVAPPNPYIAGLTSLGAEHRLSNGKRIYGYRPVIWQIRLLDVHLPRLKPDQANVAKGGVGTIHFLSAPDGTRFVGKEINHIGEKGASLLMHEYLATKKIYDTAGSVPANIVRVFGIADVSFVGSDKKRLLIMERIEGPTGSLLIHRIKERPVYNIEKINLIKYTIRSLLVAAQYGSRAGVVHNDLKPPNFMYDKNGTLKVIDWGLWGEVGGMPLGGTRGYEAPESRQEHLETVTVALPEPAVRIVREPVTKKSRIFGFIPIKRKTYQYRSIMNTEIRCIREKMIVPPSADEKCDVFSIGVILRNLIEAFNVTSPLGESLFRRMTAIDRADRIGIADALADSFLGNVSERMAALTLSTVFGAGDRNRFTA
ncbi:hypothetical protein GWC77_26835 [Paraburkholderia sp. NMBU_R16]|uniref:protein kinase domain-containing protein n=1 Tax=Paraburkholderia sp. NMBU_R16 TaxID=2698676 RepID=UPI00156416ED|nr:hypothetical protein [Paraburkholderia sp. NMBU_R16]NRO99493.1 hypothetical protein [Paraburkholderia sp. NMBU_R16]